VPEVERKLGLCALARQGQIHASGTLSCGTCIRNGSSMESPTIKARRLNKWLRLDKAGRSLAFFMGRMEHFADRIHCPLPGRLQKRREALGHLIRNGRYFRQKALSVLIISLAHAHLMQAPDLPA
jgi:hypothetical protein